MSSIRLKVRKDILLLIFIKKANAANPVLVIQIGIHDGNFISTFLKIILGNIHEICCSLRQHLGRVNYYLLNLMSSKVNRKNGEVEIVDVEDDLSKPIVLIRLENNVVVVADTVLSDDGGPLISRVLIQTHDKKSIKISDKVEILKSHWH